MLNKIASNKQNHRPIWKWMQYISYAWTKSHQGGWNSKYTIQNE